MTTMTMDECAKSILDAAGVTFDADIGVDGSAASSSKPRPIDLLENWLDLPESSQADIFAFDCQLMEDSGPFPDILYQRLAKLVCNAWRPEGTKSILSNALLEQNWKDPLKDSNLYEAFDSLRVTRLLRHWMDLNIMGSADHSNAMNDGDGDDGDDQSLSHVLLKPSLDGSTAAQSSLITALYYHLEQLPQLRSQIHLFTQSLSRTESSSAPSPATAGSSSAVLDPTSRLAKYLFIQQVGDKLTEQWEEHTARLEYIVGEWYATQSFQIRRQCRAHLGSVWTSFITSSGAGGMRTENTTSIGVQITLRVLLRILNGMASVDKKSCEHLLMHHLMPLHKPNSMVLWRDQTSLLELYHESLVQCIAAILKKKHDWIPKVLNTLLEPDIWPQNGGNTPKLVLLLHEIDTYISITGKCEPMEKDALGNSLRSVLTAVGRCMSSDHSQLAQRGLAFFKNKTFQALIELNFAEAMSILLPFLVRREPSWNPSVRKMTYYVLKRFEDYDSEKFFRLCDRVFCHESGGRISPMNINPGARDSITKGDNTAVHPVPKQKGIAQLGQTPTLGVSDFSLKAGMGSWKPTDLPKTSRSSGARPGRGMMPPPAKRVPTSATPPLTVTGVAPWAMNSSKVPAATRTTKGGPPPVTITGVAPWAMKQKLPTAPGHRIKQVSQDRASNNSSALTDSSQQNGDNNASADDTNGGSDRVRRYMDSIKPPEDEHGSSTWAKAQMAESPTLLPDLKFHDLVFGHDLGHGAFGSVRYARLIDKSRTRSHWAEYAVKVVSTEKIKELGYEVSVQREIAILRLMSHPGIARLISSFRFQEGVYLVLEYASGGDLHSLLQKNGSIDEDSTRFVIGEIIASLSSIHELGFVYGDLKPENVVITETGHVKLTDFGGSRPVTSDAKSRVESSSANILKQLRDGGWKSSLAKNRVIENDIDDVDDEDDDNKEAVWGGDDEKESEPECAEDFRVEGTTAYLPPEVVLGEVPTCAADIWALGCVLYQCLSGRPPILEDDDGMTRHKIVTFDSATSETTSLQHELFDGKHSSGIPSTAQALILKLLDKVSSNRPSVNEVAADEFFSSTDVFALHRHPAHPLDVGEVAPVADSKWSRRQFSSIWAPQPKAYDIGLGDQEMVKQRHSSISTGAIEEGEEIGALFSKSAIIAHGVGCGHASTSLKC